MTIFSPNGISSLLISISLFSIFIVLFFFLYARRVEEKIVEKQVQNMVDDMYDDLETLRVPKDFTKIILTNMNNPDLTEDDIAVVEHNKMILKRGIIFCGSLLVLSGIGIFYIWKKYKIDIKTLFKNGLIVLVFIAITEFYFLGRIAQNYNALDPNVVKLQLLKNIQGLKD